MATGQLFYDPVSRPISGGQALPLAYYNFYVSGTTIPAPVYQDAALTLPFPTVTVGSITNGYVITGDGTGAFVPIFLNPSTVYRIQLYNSAGQLLEDVDPFVPSFPITGNGPLTFNAQNEMTLAAPTPGGTGVAFTIVPAASGKSLVLAGSSAGNAALIINNSVTVGTQTANFTATNKPGIAAQAVTGTAAPTGTWTGGNLTATWTGVTGSFWTIITSLGQVIPNCTFTNGSTAYTTPSTVISGSPTTALTVQPGPAKWLPFVCDGGTYYAPLWQ